MKYVDELESCLSILKRKGYTETTRSGKEAVIHWIKNQNNVKKFCGRKEVINLMLGGQSYFQMLRDNHKTFEIFNMYS